ncbi:MAG: hypothetical protein LBK74_06245, partial [Treponema sp.]|jgi:hypothetical protein|nr:hypothetical protein [Treponema sp.]
LVDIGWPTGTFDGNIAPGIGLILGTNLPVRKVDLGSGLSTLNGTARTSTGDIQANFQGNITTSMARYLKDTLGITEFRNTNIYGNYNQWEGKYVNHQTPNFTNVGLVGNYNGSGGNAIISTVIKGVLDIQGPIAGAGIININSTKTGYLKLIGDMGSNDSGYRNFSVVDVTGVTANIDRVGKSSSSGDNADVIIFASKTQANTISGSSGNPNSDAVPTYRAFEAGGVRKYAPYSFGGNIGSPTNPSGQVPNLSEQAWEDAASNTGAAPSTINASGNTWSSENELVP